MIHAKYRFGTFALLAFLLTTLSGMASAQTTYKGKDVAPLPGVTSTGSYIPPESLRLADLGGIKGFAGTLRLSDAYLTLSIAPSAIASKNKDPCDSTGKPILPQTGTKVETYPVFAMPGEMGLKYVMYYNTAAYPAHWTNNLQYWLDTDCSDQVNNSGRCHQTIAHFPDGSTLLFGGGPDGTVYTEQLDNGQVVTSPVVALTRDTTTGNYTLQDEDATTEVFSSTGQIQSIKDASDIGWTFGYAPGQTYAGAMPSSVTHTNGQSINITAGPLYQGEQDGKAILGQVVTVSDPANNAYTLEYGNQYSSNASLEDLASISFPGTPATDIFFKYTNFSAVPYGDSLSEVDYNGTPYAYTTYVTTSDSLYYEWANSTSLADGSELDSVAYVPNSAGNLVATLTNPLGHVSTHTYAGTNGVGGANNGQLSSISDDAVADCGATESSRSYDSNGNLSQTVDNNGNVHTYDYAANGQLQTETEAFGTSEARTTDYVWDPDLQLNRLTSITVEGWSRTVYTYNAQNRLASVAVTNLSGNGIANQTLTTSYNYALYGNGMVHTLSVTHPSPSNSDTDVSTYDTVGNLTSFANGLGQTTTYSNYNGLGESQHIVGPNGDTTDYVYDARGRVQTKTTYPNGTAASWQYDYDGFGLLSTLTAPDNEVTIWNRDAEMRVRTITHNDKDGTSTETFGYDPNGDVTSHVVTRGGVTSLAESVLYDALGRVYQKQGQHGQTLTYGYDGNGNVLTVTDAVGHSTVNVYDHLDRLAQTTESGGASPLMPSTAPTLSVPATSTDGSYTVSWSGVTGATRYLLQASVNGGSWSSVQNNSATSLTTSGFSGGTYSYRVQACNATGCGPLSNVGSVLVTHVTGTIDGVSIDGSGNASVAGWACSTGLPQSIGVEVFAGGPSGGGGTRITTATANLASEPAVATACQSTGTAYRFSIALTNTMRSQYPGAAIYMYGDSPVGVGNLVLNQSGSFVVPVNEPAGAPTLTVPASSNVSHYTVSWSAVTGATSYTLQEQVNGGSWATVQNSAAISWGATGKSNGTYGYHVQACNSSGCSAWSVAGTVTVSIPPIPASAPVLSAPSVSYTGGYTVSWGGVSGATSYTLQEQVNGGGWSTAQANGSTSWSTGSRGAGSYGYRAQACNVTGCGPWSGTGTVVVTAPTSAPGLSVPANNATGSYAVSWSGVTGATSYTLQKQVNGGGWSTVQSSTAASWNASGQTNGSYGYRVQACDPVGCGPWSGVGTTVVTIPVPIAINGQTYQGIDTVGSNGGSSAEVGFEIVGSNSWGVFTAMTSSGAVMAVTGAVPTGATKVQYTWTEVGLASGATLAGGTVTNGASSPTALSGNPMSEYSVAVGRTNTNIVGLTYHVTVTFYNAAGINISSSTCTMTAEAESGE